MLLSIFGSKLIAMEWKHPDTITGGAATDGRYLRRETINDQFWREVRKGNHILLVAPRRVGKTSMMKDLVANCPEGFSAIYEDIEGVRTRNDFYKRLFELILLCARLSKLKEAAAFIHRCMQKYSIKEISKEGVIFDTKAIDYEKEFRGLIPELKHAKLHTVIFLDEFAEVIHQLKISGCREDAVNILHTLREIRQNRGFEHFTIVYAGSVGLEFVIRSIGRPKLINDLHAIQLNALSEEEASRLVRQLTKDTTVHFSGEALTYLKKKINHLLPYYLQLMVEAIGKIAFEYRDPTVTAAMIDQAFEKVLREKKNFEDWLERLKDYQPDHFPFINEILKHAAHKNRITIPAIYEMALEYGRTDDYMDFVDELLHDGYLVESERHIYQFISPLLQQFWLTKYPAYA